MLSIKIRYSIEPRNRIYMKGYGFLSFAKKMGTHLSNKYSRKLIQFSELIGNKIADKIASVSKKTQNNKPEADSDSQKGIPKKEIYISRGKTTNY